MVLAQSTPQVRGAPLRYAPSGAGRLRAMMTPWASGRGTSFSEFAFVEQGTCAGLFQRCIGAAERYGERAYEEARTRAREVGFGKVVELNREEVHWDRVHTIIGRSLASSVCVR